MKFTIPLNPTTKKNSQRIITMEGSPLIVQSSRFLKYQRDAGYFIPKVDDPIDYPINLRAHYYRKTKHRIDLPNLNAALHDILVHYKLLKDDNCKIIVSTDGSRVFFDKYDPRTEVEIENVT